MYTRRAFLGHMGAAAAALLCGERVLSARTVPMREVPARAGTFYPVRVRGRVRADGGGIGGATVSDGLSVVRTVDDGTFDMVTSSRMQFVHLSLPAGYEIPTNPAGTARFYEPIDADEAGEMRVSFELRRREVPSDKHACILMADPQTQDRDDVRLLHEVAVPDIRETARMIAPVPVFGVACGDIMYDRLELFPEYERAVEQMGIPCFQVPGNHDAEIDSGTDASSLRTFQRYFGPTYYSFNLGEIHYVVLDDVFWFGGYIGYLDQRQLDWLEADLSFIEPGRTVVVFAHIPPFNRQHIRHGREHPNNTVVVTNRALLYRLLEPYESYLVCGHMHESEYFEEGGCEIHICGALCGAWWAGPVCPDGTPRGYSLYIANGSRLSWGYKPLGGDIGRQMRLYQPGADPAHPDELIANVWAADRHWKVLWYEDGERRGEMNRGIGRDPLAFSLYEGSARPSKHPWVEPSYADHFFYAKISPGVKRVVVEATDRWGIQFHEEIAL